MCINVCTLPTVWLQIEEMNESILIIVRFETCVIRGVMEIVHVSREDEIYSAIENFRGSIVTEDQRIQISQHVYRTVTLTNRIFTLPEVGDVSRVEAG